jgi:hypothetical protein
VSEFAICAKAAWARFIRKVCEADPLERPKCKGQPRAGAGRFQNVWPGSSGNHECKPAFHAEAQIVVAHSALRS